MKLLCAFFLLFVLGASSAAGQTITEFGPAETPLAIAPGPDGSLWFTEYWRGANKIGRITVNGEITKFLIPTDASIPSGITAGPDGAIWFTEGRGNHIGRITPSGVITEFPVPGPFIGLNAITTGPDGNLWFTAGGVSGEAPDNAIWRMTPSGTVTRFPLPAPGSAARAITVGSDGNLWFTESNNSIGRITTAAAITEFADVSERSLARLVTVLRERIGDDARNPKFLRTVHGFGYAFCGEVAAADRRPKNRSNDFHCRLSWGDREIALAEGENVLGRDPDAAVWIDLNSVSRRHARVVVADEVARLEDLGSRNGTLVNGERISSPTPLANGDRIKIGAASLVFRCSRRLGTTESEMSP
jgi:pSer/pThr/pTyr-binding forkhead associated (FHA) protein